MTEPRKTPRELQVEQAVLEFEFYASAQAAVNEMDEERAKREPESEILERVCRECSYLFSTRQPDKGTKWTQLCPSCLQDHL